NASSNATDQPSLIGRAREVVSLQIWLAEAAAGQGRLVLISGEAGIGKTTLVEDLAQGAAAAEALALWGHCYDLSVTPPYGPWIELARGYVPIGDLPPFPAFLHDRGALAAVGSQDALFSQTWDFFVAVATQQPVILILEDLHWADQESLALLRFVARQLGRHRILLLATYRVDELTRRDPLYQQIPLLIREAGAERLDLHPLDESAIRDLISQRYRLAGDDAIRLESYLAEHAEGNPLYAGELLRTLEDDRVLSEEDASWQLGDLSRVRLPPLLMQVIEGRLGRLEEEPRRLLEVAAVIGQEVPLDLWQQVSEADEAALITAITAGIEGHLLLEGTSGTLHFSHALVREALYQGIVLVRRRAWHRDAGGVLAETHAPDPDAVAHHFEEAGDPRAIEWLIQAGERAQAAYAWVTAAARFEAALARMTEQDAPAVERAVLLHRTAFLLRYADTARALRLMDEARALALEAGEPGLASVCQFHAGLYRLFQGDARMGLDAMKQGVVNLDALDAAAQARCWSLLGFVDQPIGTLVLCLAEAGRLDEVRSRGSRMLAEIPTPEVRSGLQGGGYFDGLLGLASVEALLGYADDASQLYQQALDGYQAMEHYYVLTITYALELANVQIAYFPDNYERRRRLARQSTESSRRAQGANPTFPVQWGALPLMVLEGAWKDAREVALRTLRSGSWAERSWVASSLALVSREQGDLALARSIVADALTDGPATEPGNTILWDILPLQRLAAGMALDIGDLDTARAWLEAHDRWLDWSGAVLGRAEGALGWAEYHRAGGTHPLSRQRAEQALAHASEPRQPLALIAVHRFLGSLDTEAKRFDAAEGHLRQSLTLADACAAPFERALTLLERAGLRLAQRRVDEAQALLAEVRAICEPLEAKPTLARVAALEERLAASPVKPVHLSYPAGLTAREVEVLRLVAHGLSNPAIADQLFLSRRTVDTHLSTIYRKLDVTTRTAAARFAIEHDLA
ncbi:MAG TPA: AAA family ATPase, partial [Thermomicrobiaceae bacterium]|nr:AAA family ATPase [Thermomicrobiaceae bacterium]